MADDDGLDLSAGLHPAPQAAPPPDVAPLLASLPPPKRMRTAPADGLDLDAGMKPVGAAGVNGQGQPGFLSRAWNWAGKGLASPDQVAQAITGNPKLTVEQIRQEANALHPEGANETVPAVSPIARAMFGDNIPIGWMRNYAKSALTGMDASSAEQISNMYTSPLGIATMGAGPLVEGALEGSGAIRALQATRAGRNALKAARTAEVGMNTGFGAQGAANAYTAATDPNTHGWEKAANVGSGVGQAILGGTGAASRYGDSFVPAGVDTVKRGAQAGASAVGKVFDPLSNMTPGELIQRGTKPRNTLRDVGPKIEQAMPEARRAADQLGINIDTMGHDEALAATRKAKQNVWDTLEQNHLGPAATFTRDTSPVADSIDAVADGMSDIAKRRDPALVDGIRSAAKDYRNQNMSVSDMEQRIEELNNEMYAAQNILKVKQDALRNNPQYAYKFAEVEGLRSQLNQALDQVTGPGAADLKRTYGSLKTLEGVLDSSRNVAERPSPAGIFKGLGRMAGAGNLAGGAWQTLTGHLGEGIPQIAKGAGQWWYGNKMQEMNDRNFLVREAFKRSTPAGAPPGPQPVTPPPATAAGAPPVVPPVGPFAPGAQSGLPFGVPFGRAPVPPVAGEAAAPAPPESGLTTGPLPERNQPIVPPFANAGQPKTTAPEKGAPAAPETPQEAPQPAPAPAPEAPREPEKAPEPKKTEPEKPKTPPPSTRPEPKPLTPGERIEGQDGRATSVRTPNGGQYPGKYRVVEGDTLTPSHDPQTFAKNPDYPEGVQERAYHSSKEAQQRVIEQSQNYDPEYTVNTDPTGQNGPAVVTPDGTVLGGNSRVMSTQRLYQAGQGDVYKNALIDNAAQFGLDPEQIRGMKNPQLVREIEQPGSIDEMRRIGKDLNRSMTGGMSTSERAVSAGRSLKPESLADIGRMVDEMGEDSTLRDVLSSPSRNKNVLDILQRDGLITDRERPSLTDKTGGLNEDGKNLAEKAILGSIVDDPDLMDRTPKNVLNKLGSALGDLASLGGRGDHYNLAEPIREALREHVAAADAGGPLEDYLSQKQIFAERNPAVEVLARALDGPAKNLRAALRSFAQDARADVPGQAVMPGMQVAKPTPVDAFNHAFKSDVSEADFNSAFPKPATPSDEQVEQWIQEAEKQYFDRERYTPEVDKIVREHGFEIAKQLRERDQMRTAALPVFEDAVQKAGLSKSPTIESRTKTVVSAAEKMSRKGGAKFSDLGDTIGMRAKVENIADAYKLAEQLKALHGANLRMSSGPGAFDDAIKNPKGAYRALHFEVEINGVKAELQIQTHNQADLAYYMHEKIYKGKFKDDPEVQKYVKDWSDLLLRADQGEKVSVEKEAPKVPSVLAGNPFTPLTLLRR